MKNYQDNLFELFEAQAREWPLLKSNLEGLTSVRLKKFSFNGFTMQVQYNPSRIISSAAKVDDISISERKCFLCRENRPPQQKMLLFNGAYEFLCNPFPIFEMHFTLSCLEHKPQEIGESFLDFLGISRQLPDLTVFYNAPRCGASAPDHLHFQAGSRGLMPIEWELGSLKKNHGQELNSYNGAYTTAVDDGIRRFIVIESSNMESISMLLNILYEYAKEMEGGDEPMLNILSMYRGSWMVIIFFRERHRPWQYFETGDKNILLSPASVDYGGTLITPLEKDFIKISSDDIKDIFNQVSLNPDAFDKLTHYYQSTIKSRK